jgi:type IV pilus assembly protein PilB
VPIPSDTLSPAVEQALRGLLVQDGLVTSAQLQAVQHYSAQHKLDLRAALLKLKLVPPDQLAKLVNERIPPILEAVDENLPVLAEDPESASPKGPAETHGTNLASVPDEHPIEIVGLSTIETGASTPSDLALAERNVRGELREIAATAGPVDLVTEILGRACDCRATDVHFDPQESYTRVRYRIDGQLHDVIDLEFGLATSVVSRLKVMSNLNIVERRHAQDGRITIRYKERSRDLRIATAPMVLGEKVVVRIHETLNDSFRFDQLGFSPREADQLGELCAKPYGAVLVAGPVGAGKTTTLYSCLSRVNIPTRNIMTIEDPIEHRLAGLNQMQVDNRVDVGFAEGLKAMLRQDPDVIMIGEIRDEQTAQIGIRAAMTGVLVFSTIHAADSPGTIGNLYEFKIPGYLLSNTLLGVVSQRLMRKICPFCREEFLPTEKEFLLLGLEPDDHPNLLLSKGKGCASCFQTGYLGRTGIFEIMEIGEVLRELIFQQISKEVLRKVAVELGMQTLRSSAVDRVLQGLSTVEEVYRVVSM